MRTWLVARGFALRVTGMRGKNDKGNKKVTREVANSDVLWLWKVVCFNRTRTEGYGMLALCEGSTQPVRSQQAQRSTSSAGRSRGAGKDGVSFAEHQPRILASASTFSHVSRLVRRDGGAQHILPIACCPGRVWPVTVRRSNCNVEADVPSSPALPPGCSIHHDTLAVPGRFTGVCGHGGDCVSMQHWQRAYCGQPTGAQGSRSRRRSAATAEQRWRHAPYIRNSRIGQQNR